MKVKKNMIDRELRFRGIVIGRFLKILFFREQGLRITRRLSKKVMMGSRSDKLGCDEVLIEKVVEGSFGY